MQERLAQRNIAIIRQPTRYGDREQSWRLHDCMQGIFDITTAKLIDLVIRRYLTG